MLACGEKRHREDEMADGDACVSIIFPTDNPTRRIIDLMAKNVASYGQAFERVRT
jgi:hypothetical protein